MEIDGGEKRKRKKKEIEKENRGVREERVNSPSFINIFYIRASKLIYGS